MSKSVEDLEKRFDRALDQAAKARRRPGCFVGQIRLLSILVVVILASGAACALFLPATFQSFMSTIRNAGLNTYVTVLGSRGREALKVITYDSDVTAIGKVSRDLNPLVNLFYGEAASAEGTVRVSLGADLLDRKFGIISCDIDTDKVRTTVNRALFSGTAFDTERIEQAAFNALKQAAADESLKRYWMEARRRLEGQFTTWALGLEIPTQPTLTSCPVISDK
jgi:hypothetical protein